VPDIAVDNSGNLHVVWADTTSGNWEIYYAQKPSGGAWSAPVNISNTAPGESFNSDIAVDNSGNICVVWQDYATSNWEIYYATSTDGVIWSPPVNISNNLGVSAEPAIAIDNSGNLHVVWQDDSLTHNEIYYANSTDGGTTWSPPVIITGDDYISVYPDIAIDSSSNLHVVWQDGIPSEIYYAISPDGSSWSHLVNISRNPSSNSRYPDIAIDSSSNLHVVWQDDSSGNWEICYATSADGVTWSAPDNISNNSGNSYAPAIAIDNNDNPHVVWQEQVSASNWEIYYASAAIPTGGRGGGLSGGAIAGIVVGSCAAAGLIAYFVIRRKRKRRTRG
jgi:hypothetical protein